MTEGNLIFF